MCVQSGCQIHLFNATATKKSKAAEKQQQKCGRREAEPGQKGVEGSKGTRRQELVTETRLTMTALEDCAGLEMEPGRRFLTSSCKWADEECAALVTHVTHYWSMHEQREDMQDWPCVSCSTSPVGCLLSPGLSKQFRSPQREKLGKMKCQLHASLNCYLLWQVCSICISALFGAWVAVVTFQELRV